MKRYGAVLLSLLLLFLPGCEAAQFDGSRIVNDDRFILEYSAFHNIDSERMDLREGDVLAVKVVSDSGKLSIRIQKDGEAPVYQGSNLPTGSFRIEIPESGAYKITVTGDHARGSVSFIRENE